MPFDEELRRQFETLTDRIRDEVTRQLATATGELTASVEAERSTAVSQAAADASAAAEQQAAAHLTEAVAGAERDADVRISKAVASAEQEAAARLTKAVAAAEQEAAARLTEAVAAAEDRGRAAGREEGQQKGLAQGRQEGRDDADGEARGTARASGERFVEAVRAMDRARSLSEILDTLASWAGREAARVGVLLVRDGQLRAWRFIGFDPAMDDASALELPLEGAGIIAEAVKTGQTAFAESGHSANVPSFAQLPPGSEMLAVPIAMAGQVVAVLYADQAANETAGEGHRASLFVWPAILEVLARHATRCLEATTAFRAAQFLTERPETSVALTASRAVSGRGGESPRGASELNKGDEDEAARRYARLLISEIKLYHEPEVIAGRRGRDVAVRLGGAIARARVLYEQRVPAAVRSATDHFHAELVRTLVDGDPSLLGQAT
jgi:GAF domain